MGGALTEFRFTNDEATQLSAGVRVFSAEEAWNTAGKDPLIVIYPLQPLSTTG